MKRSGIIAGTWMSIRGFKRRLLIACVALLQGSILAENAAARDWSAPTGWTIAEATSGCGTVVKFEGTGNTELAIFLDIDGTVLLTAINDNWTSEEGKLYNLSFVIGTHVFNGNSVGYAREGKRGFLTKFGSGFLDELAAGNALHVLLGTTTVDSLTLKGSQAVVAQVRKCALYIKGVRTAEDQAKSRLANIPVDPFAGNTGTPATLTLPAGGGVAANSSPKVIIGPEWLAKPNVNQFKQYYPELADRSDKTGEAIIQCAVKADGALQSCTIISETPEEYGFGAAAIGLSGFFRLKPVAKGGQKVEGGTVQLPISFHH